MFDELLTEFNEMKAELDRRQAELSVSLRPKFGAAFQPFFAKHPKLEAITFTAYTPYFNDGDECIYSVHEPYMEACDVSELDGYSASSIQNAASFLETGNIPDEVQQNYDRWSYRNYPSAEAYLRASASDYIGLGIDDLKELSLIAADYDAAKQIIASVPDEVMKGMFGDHVKVRVTAEGVEADEYDHD